MSKIIGRFYFKLDDNENLSGLFSNNLHTKNYPENATRISGKGFTGEFNASWTDELGSFKANLKIALKGESDDIYTLHWSNESIKFYGEGFIVNGILIGDYRNFSRI